MFTFKENFEVVFSKKFEAIRRLGIKLLFIQIRYSFR